MKKIKYLITALLITIMLMPCLPVVAETDEVEYKGETLPLITDENRLLGYGLFENSSKLIAINWNMKNTNLATSYYVFGKNAGGENAEWINTVYGDPLRLRGDQDSDIRVYRIGWNTGISYNEEDYIYATDVDNYRKAALIREDREVDIGLVVKTEFRFRNNGKLLEVMYHVKNNSNTTKSFLLWSGGDTELGGNDKCYVERLDETKARGFYLHSDLEDYPAALNTQLSVFATDDEVDFWTTDKWSDMRDVHEPEADPETLWANSMPLLFEKGASFIADPNSEDESKRFPQDTAAVWYWKDQSLASGEEKVYSVLIGISNFTDDVANNITNIVKEANDEIEEETHTFSFRIDHIKGGGTIPEQTITAKGKATRPEDPIHDGNMIFDDWYADRDHTIKFDFENTIITDDTVVYGNWKLPPGTVKIIDSKDSTGTKSEILTPVKDIISKVELTEEELALKESGKDINIYVKVDDASDDVGDEYKELLEKKLDDKTEIGTYLDIGLFKQVDGEDPTKISKSKEPIMISLEIPEDLKNTDPSVERTYKLVKIEDGKLIEIELEMKDGKLLFATDDFSVYALAYVDKKVVNPDTLDSIIMYVIIFGISLIAMKTLSRKIKKNM